MGSVPKYWGQLRLLSLPNITCCRTSLAAKSKLTLVGRLKPQQLLWSLGTLVGGFELTLVGQLKPQQLLWTWGTLVGVFELTLVRATETTTVLVLRRRLPSPRQTCKTNVHKALLGPRSVEERKIITKW